MGLVGDCAPELNKSLVRINNNAITTIIIANLKSGQKKTFEKF